MARVLLHAVTYGATATSGQGLMFDGTVGFMLMLGMIVLSLSIMSTLIFSCSDCFQKKGRRNFGGGATSGGGDYDGGGYCGGDGGGGGNCGGGGGG
ncbi:hypothetical protein OROGR_020161 [Orobanche gracilis]